MSEASNRPGENLWHGYIQSEAVTLDFENPVEEMVILCIKSIQERLNIIEKKKQSKGKTKHRTQRHDISEEVVLCLTIAKYLMAYEEKTKAPGIKYTLDKIAMILKDDERILSNRTMQKEQVTKIIAEIRENPLLERFLQTHLV